MANSLKWNLHNYFCNRQEGLYATLELSVEQRTFLKQLRKQARSRIREAFSEVQEVFREIKVHSPNEDSLLSLQNQIKTKRSFERVDNQLLAALIKLVLTLNDEQRRAFLKIRPKFRTQGSFEYKTLNVPYKKPPQEMDIDDGVYFPMQMFDGAPVLAHRLMILLVDSALQSLAIENEGWVFDNSKPTCARIRIAKRYVHLDVPMYAIPEEQYHRMTESVEARYGTDSLLIKNSGAWLSDEALLDTNSVQLARRDREKWQKSDPQVVQKWFTESVEQVGEHLREACRFLKAWRDVQWEIGGGPSSIALMKCAVDTLGNSQLDGKDLGLVMQEVAIKLPLQLNSGVESPDPSDERPLFPDSSQHEDKHRNIVAKAQNFQHYLSVALAADNKDEVNSYLSLNFGERGLSSELIKPIQAAIVYATAPTKNEASQISQSMVSG